MTRGDEVQAKPTEFEKKSVLYEKLPESEKSQEKPDELEEPGIWCLRVSSSCRLAMPIFNFISRLQKKHKEMMHAIVLDITERSVLSLMLPETFFMQHIVFFYLRRAKLKRKGRSKRATLKRRTQRKRSQPKWRLRRMTCVSPGAYLIAASKTVWPCSFPVVKSLNIPNECLTSHLTNRLGCHDLSLFQWRLSALRRKHHCLWSHRRRKGYRGVCTARIVQAISSDDWGFETLWIGQSLQLMHTC